MAPAAGSPRAYERLVARFRVNVSSYERKRFANLSHEPNRAMNPSSYIALFGRHRRFAAVGDQMLLEPSGSEVADLSVPDTGYILMLDADSVIAPDYTLRLSHILARPGNETIAVVQTPYSALPKAPGALERIAGIQYIIHQGFTAHGATFWVGANSLARWAALEDIVEVYTERGYRICRFIQDWTVIRRWLWTCCLAPRAEGS
jgi:cellulose synthase (UDP-forming)